MPEMRIGVPGRGGWGRSPVPLKCPVSSSVYQRSKISSSRGNQAPRSLFRLTTGSYKNWIAKLFQEHQLFFYHCILWGEVCIGYQIVTVRRLPEEHNIQKMTTQAGWSQWVMIAWHMHPHPGEMCLDQNIYFLKTAGKHRAELWLLGPFS